MFAASKTSRLVHASRASTSAFSSTSLAKTSLSKAYLASRTFSISASKLKTFEPDYLDSAVPEIPTYPPLNIQMKSYNFDVLESYQSFVHNTAENMGVDVQETWATPAKSYKVSTFIEGSTRVKSEVNLNMFERNVHVVNLRTIDAPVLIDTIRAALPQSVHLTFHEHQVEFEEERWIPDPFINSLREELYSGEEAVEKEKEKRMAATAAKAARKQAALLETLQEDDD